MYLEMINYHICYILSFLVIEIFRNMVVHLNLLFINWRKFESQYMTIFWTCVITLYAQWHFIHINVNKGIHFNERRQTFITCKLGKIRIIIYGNILLISPKRKAQEWNAFQGTMINYP